MKYLYYSLLMLLIISCSSKTVPWAGTVMEIPEWEATEAEKVMQEAFKEILFTKVEIVDGKLVLNADESYFVSKGLPAEYYDKMLDGLRYTEKTRRQQNRELRRWARKGLIDESEADIYVQFEKAKTEYAQKILDKENHK